MFVTPNARLTATLVSITAVTTAPGNSRTIQSKTSNGANGRPASFHPAKEIATRLAARNRPATAPSVAAWNEGLLRRRGALGNGSGDRGRVGVMCAPARADGGHVGIHDRRQVQRDQLRDDQPAHDGKAQRTSRFAACAETKRDRHRT